MPRILYCTKTYKEDIDKVFSYHPKPDLVIGNNLGFKFIDIGDTDDPYFAPEMKAIDQAYVSGAEYILWYAGDALPPKKDWITPALKLLEKYPIVSPFWEDNFTDYVRTSKAQNRGIFTETDFGFEDQFFSDQAYIAKVKTMKNIDYSLDHPIKQFYPQHGGNSFECRVGQWLATTDQKRAVLKDFTYRHTPKSEK